MYGSHMKKQAKSIMFQGTGSGVGKSIVCTAFCRLLKRRGFNVAPFKAQNMALNSFVTADGREMGRAQVFQAEACGLLPDVRMNPVLLKPSGDSRSQVILMGKPERHMNAADYYERSPQHWKVVRSAFDSLASEYDVVVIEGAGSPAEINLQHTDIVNMKMAAYADASVIIVADIDKGGVFASLKGTFDLVQAEYRRLIKGFLINKFRGDVRLLKPGIEMFRKMVPVPTLGILPWFNGIHIDEEDGVFVKNIVSIEDTDADLRISVIRLPRISNFTDFSPLSCEPGVRLNLADRPEAAAESHVIVIPGTKATISDLQFLRTKGWEHALRKFLSKGGFLIGICGGYQILGEKIVDDYGADGTPGTYTGLGFLPVVTHMAREKTLMQVKFTISNPALSNNDLEIEGYEIHMGKTWCKEKNAGLGDGMGTRAGIFDPERSILGTYIHGIFENDEFRNALLNHVRRLHRIPERPCTFSYRRFRASQMDLLSNWLEKSCRVETLISMING